MIKVIICDDHPIFREGLKKILSQAKDIAVEGEASSGGELLDMLKTHPCQVISLDLAFPGSNGLELLKTLRIDYPKIAILILSMYPEDQYAVRALKAGAAGYVVKGSGPDELLTAIKKTAGGGRYVSPTLAEQLVMELDGKRGKAPHEDLSEREYQVLRLLAAGKSVREIAHELFLSPPTIGTYRARIRTKLHLKNTADIIHYAIEHNLLD
jgi:two-component system invasion response regulator UvrY